MSAKVCGSVCFGGMRGYTVAHDIAVAVFDDVEEGWPFHEIGEVELEVVVFGQRIEVGEIQREEVARGHAAD